MNLTHLHIRNYCGAREIDLALTTPVTLIAGRNGQGKSSIAEAIRHAMLGGAGRVALKKDFAALVSDGAKKGEVTIGSADDGEAVWRLNLPAGKQSGPAMDAELQFTLDPARLAALDDNQRRTLVLNLADIGMDAETIGAKLAGRGRAKAHIAALPLDRGIAAAARVAAERASEARGAWKEVTGEAYGSVKAETWAATVPPQPDEGRMLVVRANLDNCRASLAARRDELHKAKQQQATRSEFAARRAGLEGKAALYARAQDKVIADEAELERCRAMLAETEAKAGAKPPAPLFACPCCDAKLYHRLADGAAMQWVAPETPPDAEAAEYLPKLRDAVALCERTVSNSKRDRDAADSAARALDALGEPPEAPDDAEVAALTRRIADGETAATGLERELADGAAAVRAADHAGGRTARATMLHRDVQAWEAIAADLAPDGVQAELIGSAIAPLNERLAQSAADTGWPVVSIEHDMRILAGGRPYALLSESEKWRADAMLGEAIAHLSGLRILLLDRMDVLDLPARSQLLGWLHVLAEAREVDSVIVLATLKAVPGVLPETFAAHWIEGGQLVGREVAVAA